MDCKASTVKVPAIPLIVKKGSTLTLLKNNLPNDLLMRCIKLSPVTKDQPIYKSVPGDFLRGEFPDLTLFSRFNVLNQASSTIARFTDGSGHLIEKNSNEVVKVIGQNNYETVFSALCSVISQELRIRALLALLTIERSNKKKEHTPQTEKSFADCSCQTDETSKNILDTFKIRRRIVRRQQFRPYIVKENDKKVKRIVIDPKYLPPTLLKPEKPVQSNTSTIIDNTTLSDRIDAVRCTTEIETKVENESLPELSQFVNEDSNFSDISIGNISLTSQHSVNIPLLLENPTLLLDNVDIHTDLNIVPLTLLDGSVIMVCAKPMDKFHWAAPEILKNLSDADRTKLLYHQVIIHWKYCLERDEDGYLPIHHAVMTNDLEFLSRQCAALVKKYGSVDVPAADNMTALQMSIKKEGERCTELLLRHGADPRLQDDEGRSFFHTAAELSPHHLQVALDHCRANARAMLKDDEDLWNPLMESQSDEQLAKILLDHICIMCDNQGYTPLMLASKQGEQAGARLLAAASPDTVNRPMPTSGSTALYLAVEAACIEAANSKNQTKISDDFLKTIEILMESGGDPSLENHSGSSVNMLLTEFNIVDLSVLIANKLTSVKYFDGNAFAPGNINSLMLFKNSDGKVNLTEIRPRKPNCETNAALAGTTTITANARSKRNVNLKKTNTPNVSRDKKKSSKVEIKEIKTIKVEAGAEGEHPGGQLATAAAVNVKPQHIFIFPKNKPNPNVPKYVKIAPKLDNMIETAKTNIHIDLKHSKNKIPIKKPPNVKGQAGATSKNKRNPDCEPTPVKKQRKDTKHGQARSSGELGSKSTSNVGIKSTSNVGSKSTSNVGIKSTSNVGSKSTSNVGSKSTSNVGIKSTSNVGIESKDTLMIITD